MSFLKRLEVWLLLILAAALGAFVLVQSTVSDPDEALITDAAPANAEGKPALLGLTIERDHGNARLDIDVRLTNPNARRLLLVAPAVRLLNAKGAEVPAFILPVEPPPELPPSTEATAKLRFWLEQEDLAGKLTLELVGTTLEVKPDKAFDLETLKNAEPKRQPW
jgi:hypothetical protein